MIGLKSFVLVSLVLGADFKILTGTVDTFEVNEDPNPDLCLLSREILPCLGNIICC